MHHEPYAVPIDESSMERTILLCQKEQEALYQKYDTLPVLICRFVKIDMRFYLLSCILGFLIMILLMSYGIMSITTAMPIYFFTLGLMTTYEIYKHVHYQMIELISALYLNPGRALLIKSNGFILVELLMFIIMTLLFHTTLLLDSGIMECLVPLCTAQIFTIAFLHHIHSYYSAFLLYILAYSGYFLVYNLILRPEVSLYLSCFIFIIELFVYFCTIRNIVRTARNRGGHTYGTDTGTYL